MARLEADSQMFDSISGGIPDLTGQPVGQEYIALVDIIENKRIRTVFQPIVDLRSGEVYAYEALSRIVGDSPFSGPDKLFKAAQRMNMTAVLEKLCIIKALENAGKLGIKQLISLNICPSVLRIPDDRKEHEMLIDLLFSVRDRVILELTETFQIQNNELFRKNINYYMNRGFRIAIDDLGSGYMGLKILADLEPYLVKIDRFFLSDIAGNTKKRMLVESITAFCHKINSRVVAEGIETKEELNIVMDLSVDLGQGYFLARPSEHPVECSEEAVGEIRSLHPEPNDNPENSNLVGPRTVFVKTISIRDDVETVSELFNRNKDLTAVPVLNGNNPVGIIERNRLFGKLGTQFGYALYSKRSVAKIMEPVLIFDYDTPLEEVSRKVLKRDEDSVYNAVVIMRHGVYSGIVKIYDILQGITDQKIRMARQANPLTGLPGNNVIKEEIMTRLKTNQVFAVFYFDLDHFKPFNDNFGFDMGDRVIRFLGNLLKDCLKNWDLRGFLGHVGGDDFVAVCRAQGIETICKTILNRFDEEVKQFHDEETVQRGFFESNNRAGESRRYRLLSLTIGVVTTNHRIFGSYGHLVSIASEIKKKAKLISGSSYYIDQRKS